MSTSKVTDL